MGIEKQLLEVTLKEVEAMKTLVKIVDVAAEPAVKAGDNFLSTISRVQCRALLGNGRISNISVIAKKLPDQSYLSEYVLTSAVFDTEIKMYAEILPEMEAILREEGIPPAWPGYLGKRENILFFTDLKSKNYEMRDRCLRLDLQHSLLALDTLGTFHAASIILQQRGLLDSASFKTYYFLRDQLSNRHYMTGGLKVLAQVIQEEWGPEWQEIANKMVKNCHHYFNRLVKLAEAGQNRLNVVCHGDTWTANMMFKYPKHLKHCKAPSTTKFIDFQLCHYNSPGFDLIYFLLGSVQPGVRREHRQLLLQSYVDSMNLTLDFHQYSGFRPTLEYIEDELERLELFEFLMGICSVPIVVSQFQDPFDFEKITSVNETEFGHNPQIYRGHMKEEMKERLIKFFNKKDIMSNNAE